MACLGRRRRDECLWFPIPAGVMVLMVFFPVASYAERAYPLGCSKEPTSYYDYGKSTFPPPDLPLKTVDDYLIVQRLGTGKFSDVFEAVDVEVENQLLLEKQTPTTSSLSKDSSAKNDNNTLSSLRSASTEIDPRSVVVLKCLKPVSERKVRREIMILQHASKLPNMARIKALVLPSKDKSSGDSIGVPTLVLEHAGPDCRWLSHYGGGSTAIAATMEDRLLDGRDSAPSPDDGDDDDDDTTLNDYEIRYYIFHLLIALDTLHQKGIMHRDVKPRNCLIRRLGHTGSGNRPQDLFSTLYSSKVSSLTGKDSLYTATDRIDNPAKHNRGAPLMLIDLGLADFYLPKQKYNVRVASRHYKSPELLVGYEYYDYALDLWGVGCILASLLCFREPFFRGKDNVDQLGKIIMQLGTTDLWAYILKYNIQVDSEVKKLIQSYHATAQHLHRKPWVESLPPDSVRRKPDEKGLDLLDKLLVYDHEERWNARQAMEHPFFDIVRRRVLTEVLSYAESGVVLPSLSNLPTSSASERR